MSDSNIPMSIQMSEITLKSTTRPRNDGKVRQIAASFENFGQVQPIHVYELANGGYGIAAGLHRFEAAKALRWQTIAAVVLSRKRALTWRWTENNDRYHIDPLTESIGIVEVANGTEHLRECIETKGGKQPNDKGYSKLAKKIGRSRKRVREAFQHHKLPKCVRDEIYKNPEINKRTELTKLAKMKTTEEQLEYIQKRLPDARPSKRQARNKPSSRALSMRKLGKFTTLRKSYEETGFKSIFEKQSDVVRKKFIEECLQ